MLVKSIDLFFWRDEFGIEEEFPAAAALALLALGMMTFWTTFPPWALAVSFGARTKFTCLMTDFMLLGVFDCCMIGGGKSEASIPSNCKPLLRCADFLDESYEALLA